MASLLTAVFPKVLGKGGDKMVVILTMSALRACDVNRVLRKVPGGSIKLIKKNKLEYDRKALGHLK